MHRSKLKNVALSLLVIFAVGASVQAAEYYNKFPKNDERRGEPEEGHALVYVFRPAVVAAAVKTWAFVDDDLIMVSKPKAYSFAQVPAGKRLFWTKSENTSALEMDVVAGETYYFKVAIKAGFNKARAKIVQVDAEEAKKFFDKCGYVEPSDEGLARAVEIAANRKDRAVNKAAERKKKN
ncbi:MAG: DUF2846 domain-containing protein [Acidobacteriota bacterium]|nr:DUF2846 domain-containing protein [Acidobacteriota bacterium]MDH3785217.1 DUF2846 domain-containing protein [Acidobacteriota bacterium]